MPDQPELPEVRRFGRLRRVWDWYSHIDTAGGIPSWIAWLSTFLPVGWKATLLTYGTTSAVFVVALARHFSLPAAMVFAVAAFALFSIGWWFFNDARNQRVLEAKFVSARTINPPAPQASAPESSTSVARVQANAQRASAEAMERWIESLKPRLEVIRTHAIGVPLGYWDPVYATVVSFTNRGATAKNLIAQLRYGESHVIPYGVWIGEPCQGITLGANHTKELVVGGALRAHQPSKNTYQGFFIFEDRRRCTEPLTLNYQRSNVVPTPYMAHTTLHVSLRADGYEKEFVFEWEVDSDAGVVCRLRP